MIDLKPESDGEPPRHVCATCGRTFYFKPLYNKVDECMVCRWAPVWKAEEESMARMRADIALGNVQIMGEWIVLFVDQCTCSGSPAGHQSGCGYEPLVRVETALLATSKGAR